MKISLIQTPLTWENHKANRDNFTERINSIEATDLIVLPEMFTTGFTMQPEGVAEKMEGESVVWMQEMAKAKDCAITGSLVITEDGKYYNRLFFVYPDGSYKTYDKRHLFTLAGEEKYYTAGSDRLVLEYRGWKICPLVCYDLRFPIFSRNTEDFDLLLYVANWPQVRIQAWDALLKARAIENMCYIAGVNRIGQDNNGHNYSGHSQVIGGLGDYVVEPFGYEDVFTVELDKTALHKTRKKFGFLNDRDSFTLLD
ncbi:amidohydrolase [Flavobacterium arcticum]|uniref:Omega-amidase YafV n=1 Tax=Flavobacterium arcticum TaxID=1784713 RepID=A0A345HBR9_9FLAO|nr:amidohydrolase [Flavobacterium arcticum]AXG74029.1 amidohydrolase [Flavobacterium arcticum]KAF2509007.1 amidohydrolase [Flavobacterium arcticum]